MNQPGPSFLEWQVRDAQQRFLSAPRDEKLAKARKVIRAKFERGDYQMLQDLDYVTLEVMAKELLERFTGQSTQPPPGAAIPPRTAG